MDGYVWRDLSFSLSVLNREKNIKIEGKRKTRLVDFSFIANSLAR